MSGRAAIAARLTELLDYEKIGSLSRHGDRTFFYRNSGLQNQYVLYVVNSVGACFLQRLDLFGAASPAVGVLDMLRLSKSHVRAVRFFSVVSSFIRS